jgi:hypothetical protein
MDFSGVVATRLVTVENVVPGECAGWLFSFREHVV